ncbi:PspC domain-containing protein [Aurantiacibacter poecillastricola]|uniref:PspC domain-containing protein n=1 Tax=Aurantiacibacter poecillastricola TaxID=3064385 RepID=UPI00273DF4F5|nr:PspC domain-containing protein [Aurantiacibacter sp. 219JJ12-13]MDP5262958.1 PspC domain-containing protein [Aurantiacibacter sp. 219JJ12-13]
MSNIDRSNHGVNPAGSAKFRLDKRDGKIAGVCAGIANYFGINPLIFRLVFLVGAIAGFGSFILIYLAIWLLAG